MLKPLWDTPRKDRQIPDRQIPGREPSTTWGSRINVKNPVAKPRDRDQDWASITGDFDYFKPLDSKKPSTKRVLRIFISSTFTNMNFERNYMLQEIPFLKECAAARGLELIFSEMRFGIRDEASKDNRTTDICMNELAKCFDDSAGLAYILLTCDKYGFRPPPRTIPKLEFDNLCRLMTLDGSDLVQAWYTLDENMLPEPEYVMKNQNSISDFWKSLPAVQSAFREAAKKLWPHDVANLRDPAR